MKKQRVALPMRCMWSVLLTVGIVFAAVRCRQRLYGLLEWNPNVVNPHSAMKRGDIPRSMYKEYKFTICTMIRNEAKYLPEWIAYHILQGVDHFVLYDDRSIDGSNLIVDLFEQNGFINLIEVLPALLYDAQVDAYTATNMSAHRTAQEKSLNDCNKRMTNKTEWLIFIDVDEFITPSGSSTLYNVVSDPKYNKVDVLHLVDVRFSTGGHKQSSSISLSTAVEGGKVSLLYTPAESDEGHQSMVANVASPLIDYPLVLVSHTKRMRHIELDRNHFSPDKRCYISIKSSSAKSLRGSSRLQHPACKHGNGKVMLRSGSCELVGIHRCLKPLPKRGLKKKLNPRTTFKLNHYFMRSEEDALKSSFWKKTKRLSLVLFDKTHFMAYVDDSMKHHIHKVYDILERLQPTRVVLGNKTPKPLQSSDL